MFDSIIVFYAFVFAAVLLAADTLLRFIFASRRKSQEVKNRLEAMKLKTGSDQAYTELLLRRGIRRRGAEQIGLGLARYYAQTGLEMGTPRQVLYMLGLILLGFMISFVFVSPDPLISFAVGIVFMIVMVVTIIRVARARRIKKFTAQLAPAIDIIVRSLNAGHPLNSAISLVAREMPDPIGSEFGILSDQMTFGLELDAAMMNMIERVGAPELNLLAVTVSVQRGTGGNLSEILENLAKMIRDRLMIKAKIKAISAEGRMTMWIMLSFPFILFTMIRTMVPTYFDPVWESGYGGVAVGVCGTLMLFGAIIIRKLVNFDF